ncbi:hypothetical protein B0T24DRAFT_369383 [Lasiosphaeria ovina]|uniref:Uncharacterized protein n=1 Tax=Lasiosphaeria ovina TaxID=92902 RepID=A0AAE0N1N7_9PEZI|nr:hypothetical protein B0T24DRAFT_369383 [Lasiosphaeria ovina]
MDAHLAEDDVASICPQEASEADEPPKLSTDMSSDSHGEPVRRQRPTPASRTSLSLEGLINAEEGLRTPVYDLAADDKARSPDKLDSPRTDSRGKDSHRRHRHPRHSARSRRYRTPEEQAARDKRKAERRVRENERELERRESSAPKEKGKELGLLEADRRRDSIFSVQAQARASATVKYVIFRPLH